MKILHLTSDWKWTGPAEPMLWAAAGLRSRGHEVELVCPGEPRGQAGLLSEAQARGLAPALVLSRARGIHPLRDRREAASLRSMLRAGSFDLVHAWHSRGHGLAFQARLPETAIVRAHSDGRPPRWGESWLFGRACDALVCTSRSCAASHGDAARAFSVDGAVDLERFRPAAGPEELCAARDALGVAPEGPIVGVVARVQPHRRFDLLFDAFEQVVAEVPEARLVLLGRGTRLESVARQPVAARGLAGHVHFAGYRSGESYVQALRAFDLLCFLTPGSDGGCRALLEAAASGIPAVTLGMGAPGEIVRDGETGRVVVEKAAAIAQAITGLLASPAQRARLGAGARSLAEARFGVERLAANLEAVYRVATG